MNNREIKFRALCEYETTNGTLTKMVYFGFPEMDNGLWAFPIDKQIRHINAYESPLMQYTGLKDKNGKEIYEGNIVKYSYWIQTSSNPDSSGKSFNGIGLIYFVDGCFMVKDKITIPLHYSELLIEIIGNIYENPELLNK